MEIGANEPYLGLGAHIKVKNLVVYKAKIDREGIDAVIKMTN